MRVTRWGEFGILCSIYLAQRAGEGEIGAQQISETQQVPIQYVQQILHRLKKGGIVTTVRGPHGGYRLTRPADQISLKDILAAAEGHTFEVICENDPVYVDCAASGVDCGLRTVWQELKRTVDHFLEGKTLATLAGQSRPQNLVPSPKSSQRATNHLLSESVAQSAALEK